MRDTDFTAHPNGGRLLRPLFSLLALAALMLLSLPLGASAQSHSNPEGAQGAGGAPDTLAPTAQTATTRPPGNNGTVKIDGAPFENFPDNNPHVGCEFQVDFYGYEQGDLDASVTFEAQPPSGTGVLLHEEGISIGEDEAGGGTDLDASVTFDLTDELGGLTEHEQQGYHIKLTVNAEGSIGADVKHKVFWVQCEQPTETGDVTLEKDATGDVPAGATFEFSVDCDDDDFDRTGIQLSDGGITTIVDDAPLGTECTITETDDDGADTTTFTVDDGDPAETDSVTVIIGDQTTVAVIATNDFEEEEAPATGDVTLTKEATGVVPDDATAFVFSVECDDDANAFDATITLSDGQTVTIAEDALTGTQCTITESDDEGADTTTFTVGDGEPVETDSVDVTVGDGTTVAVVATNDFEAPEAQTFSLNVLKVDEGNASNVLAGAQFRLFSDTGTTTGLLDDGDSFEGICTTDNDGECDFAGLDAGNYLLVETLAPEGFVAISDDPIAVTIVDADESITIENAPAAVGGVVAERPDIDLVKSADPVIARVGDMVTYTYVITNTGETTLSDLVLIDDKLGVILLTDVVLQPGNSTEVEQTHVVTESDAEVGEIVNVAVVTGRAPSGEEVTAEDTAEVAVVAVEGITVTRPDAPAQQPAPAPEADQLARTGAYTRWLLMLAVVALLGGVAFLRIAESREEAQA